MSPNPINALKIQIYNITDSTNTKAPFHKSQIFEPFKKLKYVFISYFNFLNFYYIYFVYFKCFAYVVYFMVYHISGLQTLYKFAAERYCFRCPN